MGNEIQKVTKELVSLCNDITVFYNSIKGGNIAEGTQIKASFLLLKVESLLKKVTFLYNKSDNPLTKQTLLQQVAMLEGEKVLLQNLKDNIKTVEDAKKLVNDSKLAVGLKKFERLLYENS